jgi:hypothetical protein
LLKIGDSPSRPAGIRGAHGRPAGNRRRQAHPQRHR